MPIYTFRFADGSEYEQYYSSWRVAPDYFVDEVGREGVRVPSRPTPMFPNVPVILAKARGEQPYERGMDRDWARRRAEQEAKRDTERREVIEKTLAEFPL